MMHAGFGPATEVLLFRQKAQKPLMSRLALTELTDAEVRGLRQLDALRQGSPEYEGVHL